MKEEIKKLCHDVRNTHQLFIGWLDNPDNDTLRLRIRDRLEEEIDLIRKIEEAL